MLLLLLDVYLMLFCIKEKDCFVNLNIELFQEVFQLPHSFLLNEEFLKEN